MTFWVRFLRGTWAIARSGGSPTLICMDIAAGIRWWRSRAR